MNRIFGTKKNTGPAPTLADASGKVDGRVKALDDKIKGLDQELIKYRDALKKAKGPAAASIKKRAMDTLKRKKMYEAQRDQLAGQQFNIDQTSFTIESIRDTQTTVAAMKDASKQMKTEFKKMNLNDIEDTVDDLADYMEDMNEVNEMLGRSYAVGDEIDEADLDAELACLDDELAELDALDEEPSSVPSGAGGIPTYSRPEATAPVARGPAVALPNPSGYDEYGLPVAPEASAARANTSQPATLF